MGSAWLVAAMVLIAHQASAMCLCGEPATPQVALAHADAVFAGTVRAVRHPVDTVYVEGRPQAHVITVYELVVGVSWKGVRPKMTVPIFAPLECEVLMEVGKKYLVYAHFDAQRRQYWTSACDRTCSARRAVEEWDALGAPRWVTWGVWGSWKL